MKAMLLLSMMIVPAFLTTADRADAQIRKPQLGIYGGGTIPVQDFKEETDIGWHVGGLIKVRVTGALDVRLDGAFNKLGSKAVDFLAASVESKSDVLFGALNAELNLGPDSAAYPGDNSISPYITAGPALYRHKFEGTCTGTCAGFVDNGEETSLGFNIGAGANIPLRGFPAFAEVRYHRFGTMFPISQEDASAAILTASFGIKIR